MQYVSTRTKDSERVSAAYAIKTGLAPDGGLYMPESLPEITLTELSELLGELAANSEDFRYLGSYSELI